MFKRRPGGKPDALGPSFFRFFSFLLICSPFLYACEFRSPAVFEFYGAGEDARIYSLSRKGVSGVFPLSRPGKWDYVFENPQDFPPDSSLELDYAFRSAPGAPAFQVMLELEGA
ncbi:MAG: hypothetical protein LBT95_08310, partial [Treponema sp.]|nr:hypothetical protein [Treponema sp.]